MFTEVSFGVGCSTIRAISSLPALLDDRGHPGLRRLYDHRRSGCLSE